MDTNGRSEELFEELLEEIRAYRAAHAGETLKADRVFDELYPIDRHTFRQAWTCVTQEEASSVSDDDAGSTVNSDDAAASSEGTMTAATVTDDEASAETSPDDDDVN